MQDLQFCQEYCRNGESWVHPLGRHMMWIWVITGDTNSDHLLMVMSAGFLSSSLLFCSFVSVLWGDTLRLCKYGMLFHIKLITGFRTHCRFLAQSVVSVMGVECDDLIPWFLLHLSLTIRNCCSYVSLCYTELFLLSCLFISLFVLEWAHEFLFYSMS